ncbi:MAG: serine hydrolase domain-containing protein [Meiothermus sp.]|nr:serine hydrolase domain-containing protein [Meiothermus sp.]
MNLPRSTPEAQGIPSGAVSAFVRAAEAAGLELHSFMLLRRGRVVAEAWWHPYAPQHPHVLYSLSKSFAATAVGLAVAEGRLGLEDRVVSFFPDELPEAVSDNLEAMTVRHLLTMASGHAKDPFEAMNWGEQNWPQHILAQPVEHAPGSRFVYNSAATYLLSTILRRATGQGLLDFLGPRLFEPLGIARPTWEACPQGTEIGGWGLSLPTEAIATFGQLYLQGGVWEGQRLLPEGWVEEATARQVDNASPEGKNPDWQQGYGYQFWRCQHGAYRGDGAFGQYCVVMPDQEAVLAITSYVDDMQAVLNLAWEHLLSAMGGEALPEGADSSLPALLSSRAIALPAGSHPGQVFRQTYRLEHNPLGLSELALETTPTGGVLEVKGADPPHRIVWSHGDWALGETGFLRSGPSKIAASGVWQNEAELTLKVCYYETPFCPVFTLALGPQQLTVRAKGRMGFWEMPDPLLEGRPQ